MAATPQRTLGDRADLVDEPHSGHRRSGVGRAHGKAILLGEHAVVYGAPALAIPVPQLPVTASARLRPGDDDGADEVAFELAGPGSTSRIPSSSSGLRRLVAEFKEWAGVADGLRADVLIDCSIPQGRGLGSSAACARAAVLALADLLGRRLDARATFDLVQASEKVTHGRASGIDALATGAASPLLFRSGTARELPLPVPGDGPAPPRERAGERAAADGSSGSGGLFVIADSGVSGGTREAVELLRRGFEREPRTREAFVGQVSDLTNEAVRDLARGRWDGFGRRMTENHRLLRDIGISTDRIDALVEAALAAGSLGAKLSGGGLGGCMIALADGAERAATVVSGLREAGAVRTWIVPAGGHAHHAD
ncbi:mevalonate kinase [Streptomyces sp. SLBN-134]|uniref:mevalonate kinase n=1 Tax=Streptomyces sp. SLBN-134 TaxID=2768456 RepID=UPI001151EE01|nr:mevalonate kinase [Streptomyces sp. SLBN-134]TQL19208.1 mevalonate kinase [Streptomyces sp. SLBN-134]